MRATSNTGRVLLRLIWRAPSSASLTAAADGAARRLPLVVGYGDGDQLPHSRDRHPARREERVCSGLDLELLLQRVQPRVQSTCPRVPDTSIPTRETLVRITYAVRVHPCRGGRSAISITCPIPLSTQLCGGARLTWRPHVIPRIHSRDCATRVPPPLHARRIPALQRTVCGFALSPGCAFA